MQGYKFLEFLWKDTRLSQDFKVVGSSFQMMGAATEKARLPRFSLVLGIESCCEVDDVMCPAHHCAHVKFVRRLSVAMTLHLHGLFSIQMIRFCV